MNNGRMYCNAARLANGEVMVTGDGLRNVELYDPVHNQRNFEIRDFLPAAPVNPPIHCWQTLRVMKLRRRLAAINANDAPHNTTSIARRQAAAGREIPMPVARATYAATHTGHLGSNANVTVGTIQPAISPPRRTGDAGRRELSPARVLSSQQ
jgi:hypothetical protein